MNETSLLDRLHTSTFLGIPLNNVLVAAAVALVAYIVMMFVLRLVMHRLSKIAGRTSNRADDIIIEIFSGTNRWLIALVAILIGVGMLALPDPWPARVAQLWFVALVLQIALWANRGIGVALRRYVERRAPAGSPQMSAAATLMSWGARILLWAMVLLAMLSNLGVNVTAFIASLGVGGIAIALAAQNILGDLFASVSIAMDKPFEVGDFIVLGSVAGTVEYVGVKTTRIRSLGGEQIVMSNTELLKQTISNYKRLMQRRIVFGFGVARGTTAAQAEAIPGIVKGLVDASTRLRFDRAHFKGFGESSLDYEAVYIVLDPGYNVYMDEQQRINLGLMRALDEQGIGFAFPTRVVHVASVPAQEAGAPRQPLQNS